MNKEQLIYELEKIEENTKIIIPDMYGDYYEVRKIERLETGEIILC